MPPKFDDNSSELKHEFSDPVSFRTRAASRASPANAPSSTPAGSGEPGPAALTSTTASLSSSLSEVPPTTEAASSGMRTPEPESSRGQQSAANDNFPAAAASGQGLSAQVLTGPHGVASAPPPFLPSRGPSYTALRSTQDAAWIQARIDNMDARTRWTYRRFINDFRAGVQPAAEESGEETESMSPASARASVAAAAARLVAAGQAVAAADGSSPLSSVSSVTTPSHLAGAPGDDQ